MSFMTNTAYITWANVVLKRRNAALSDFTKDLSQEDWSKLCNSLVYNTMELMPAGYIRQVAECAMSAVHDAAVQRGGSFIIGSGEVTCSAMQKSIGKQKEC